VACLPERLRLVTGALHSAWSPGHYSPSAAASTQANSEDDEICQEHDDPDDQQINHAFDHHADDPQGDRDEDQKQE
jgi:hypothetical protein